VVRLYEPNHDLTAARVASALGAAPASRCGDDAVGIHADVANIPAGWVAVAVRDEAAVYADVQAVSPRCPLAQRGPEVWMFDSPERVFGMEEANLISWSPLAQRVNRLSQEPLHAGLYGSSVRRRIHAVSSQAQ
jgi:hypothetical protein